MPDLSTALIVASAIIAGATVALNVIAPLTRTDKDNKALAALRFLEGVLSKLALNVKR